MKATEGRSRNAVVAQKKGEDQDGNSFNSGHLFY